MIAGSCPRRFEVEAARDGRITGRALTAIEHHVVQCKDCAAEARTLNEIADALGALPVTESDVVTVRRQRQRLLARFNDAQLVSHLQRGSHRRVVGAVVTAALVVLVVLAAIRGRQHASSAVVATAVDPAGDVVVVAPDGARWARTEDGANTRVRLEEGELSIHVKHHGEAHGLLVILPDGEIEDLGTTFRVQVQDGRTVAVSVRDGAVIFRRRQASAVLLGTGESWHADEPSAVAAIPAIDATGASEGSAASPRGPSRPKASGGPISHDLSGSASREFREAVDLLNAGNAARAIPAFRAYLAHKPTSDRAEDATYLLILALHRSGDEAGAIATARDYLRLYPYGLRRPEVEGLAPSVKADP